MDEHGFQIAFTLTDVITGELKHDPKFVSWQVITWGVRDDGSYFREYESGLHPCTELDYATFYERDPNQFEKKFDHFRKRNEWMCLDEVDFKGNKINKNLYGIGGSTSRSIDVAIIPCIPK